MNRMMIIQAYWNPIIDLSRCASVYKVISVSSKETGAGHITGLVSTNIWPIITSWEDFVLKSNIFMIY